MASCGCCSANEVVANKFEKKEQYKDSSSRCSECHQVLKWGCVISRKMFRFTNHGRSLQVRCHSKVVVTINGQPIIDGNCQNDSEHQQWSHPPIHLQDGDRIQIHAKNHHQEQKQEGTTNSNCLLEFKVVTINLAPDGINPSEAVAAGNETENGAPEDKKTVASMDRRKPSEEDKNTKAKDDKNIDMPSNLNIKDTDISFKSRTVSLEEQQLPHPKVFFVPLGTTFSSVRRKILQDNLESLGVVFVKDIWAAEYIVICETVRSLLAVCKPLKIKETKLKQHVDEKGIELLLPTWADQCTSSKRLVLPPSRTHLWPYYVNDRSIGRPTMSSSRERKRKFNNVTGNNDGNERPRQEPQQRRRHQPFRKNVQVAEQFKLLSDLHQEMPLLDTDHWKSYCFRIAAGRLLHLDFEVSSDPITLKRLRSIGGFGSSIVDKIEECVNTGTISRIHEFRNDERRVAMKNLTEIWGVGAKKARHLMALGYTNVEAIRQALRQESKIQELALDRNQLVGVDCYEDILDRMTRSEVEEIAETVRRTADMLYPGIELSIQGSYRRGKSDCGDVDIHLTHKKFTTEIPDDALGRIIDSLWDNGNIAFHLTNLSRMTKGKAYGDYEAASKYVPKAAWRRAKSVLYLPAERNSFYMGCLYSPVRRDVRRRVDIKLYPYRERAFATLYFTGNGFFNRSMRLWATRMFGYKLNDHGLFKRSDDTERVLEATTEKEIFDFLKVVYKEPTERDCWDALEPMEGGPDFIDQLEMNQSEFTEDKEYKWVE
jgi:DNA polymerase/3'-5' exonuclease PolX